MMKFGERLKKYYKGPLEVDVHHSGDLGSEKDYFEFMMQGISVDFAFIARSWIATWSKKAAFMDTPFLWGDYNHKVKALESGVFKSLEKGLIAKGVRILGYGGGGTRNMILRKPVKTMNDLPKVLMRVMGSPIQAKVFNATGVQATPMAYAEVYNAIKTGVVDGLENEAAAFGRVELAEHFAADFFLVARLPQRDVAIATERQSMAQLAPQLHDVQPCLGFQRVVGVQTHLDVVGQDGLDVAAAVVDDRQAVQVAEIDHPGDGRLKVGPPVVGREEHALAAGDISPDDKPIKQAGGRLDGCLGALVVEFADPQDLLAEALGILADPH